MPICYTSVTLSYTKILKYNTKNQIQTTIVLSVWHFDRNLTEFDEFDNIHLTCMYKVAKNKMGYEAYIRGNMRFKMNI